MMYQALYRKYRPKTFDDVVGQEHITETLKKQVETGRLSHAYLFIGTRGTGKTTCAKILAKAVNCEHPVNGNPCNRCAACRGRRDLQTEHGQPHTGQFLPQCHICPPPNAFSTIYMVFGLELCHRICYTVSGKNTKEASL